MTIQLFSTVDKKSGKIIDFDEIATGCQKSVRYRFWGYYRDNSSHSSRTTPISVHPSAHISFVKTQVWWGVECTS